MPRHVRLWGLPDVVLIVRERSGIVYTNQVMGHACMQASAEGVLVPLAPDYPIDARGRPAVDTLAERLGALLLNAPYLTEKQAAAVDAILAEYPETRGTVVARSRLRESGEAWVFVDVNPGNASPLVDFGWCAGVLTWLNSD